jgi:adenosine deaminase
MYQRSADLTAFINRLPKTETHLHLEGALPYQFLQKLDPEKFKESPPFWATDYRYPSFENFEGILIEHAVQWFTSPEHYYEAARVIFEGLQDQNVRYVETSFHIGMVEFCDIPGKEILHAIQSAAPNGLEVRVFAGMLRNHYTPFMKPIIDDLVNWDELAGIDLHGVEVWDLEDWSEGIWRTCREAGKETKAHAGEFGGAENVREVIERLRVRRVQHGVRSVEDESVVQLLLDEEVTLDICPISNVKLQVVPSMKEHPIRQLFDRGINCTISTDDPFSFGNTVTDEYSALASELNFTKKELAQIARNGFKIAQLDEAKRQQIFDEIDAIITDLA